MKKSGFLIALLFAIAATAALFFFRTSEREQVATKLVPADTVLFLYLPDLPSTSGRWQSTALCQIGKEPDVRTFLESSLKRISWWGTVQTKLAQFAALEPRESFLAITSIEQNEPEFLAGFKYSGNRDKLDVFLADIKAFAQSSIPTGSADLIKYGRAEIETFSDGQRTISSCLQGNQYLLSNRLDRLKDALDRLQGKAGSPSLHDQPNLKLSLTRLPAKFETLLFLQPQVLVERLNALAGIVNPGSHAAGFEELRKLKSITATTRFRDLLVQDDIFIISDGIPKLPKLERRSLALTSPSTIFYYTAALQLPKQPIALPDASLDRWGILRALHAIQSALEKNGLTKDDFLKAFGPESGLVLDWAANASQPDLFINLDVKDPVLATQFVETALDPTVIGIPFSRREEDGTRYYVMAGATGLNFINPAVAVNKRAVVVGISLQSVRDALSKGDQATLLSNPEVQELMKGLSEPTAAFGYLNAKGAVDRIYGTLRAFAVMAGSFMPGVSSKLDLGRLPSTESLSKHLGHVVFSQSTGDDGILIESIGPVTFNQAAIAVIGAAVAAPLASGKFQQALSPAPVQPQPVPAPPSHAPPPPFVLPESEAAPSPKPAETPPPDGGSAAWPTKPWTPSGNPA